MTPPFYAGFIDTGNTFGGVREIEIYQNMILNPNSIGVRYSLIVLVVGNIYHVTVLTSLLVKKCFLKFLIETLGICHD